MIEAAGRTKMEQLLQRTEPNKCWRRRTFPAPVALLILSLAIWTTGCGRSSQSGGKATPRAKFNHRLLFTWEGDVDGRDLLRFQADRCLVEHEKNRPLKNVRFESYQYLEPEFFPVTVRKELGRGTVTLIAQGNELNRFTVLVRVDDMHFGEAGRYRFSAWSGGPPHPPEPEFTLSAGLAGDRTFVITPRWFARMFPAAGPASDVRYYFKDPAGLSPEGEYYATLIRGWGQVNLKKPEGKGRDWELSIEAAPAGGGRYEVAVFRSPAGDH